MISIIDDDRSVREAVKCLIRSIGYDAVTFASAEEYLESKSVHDTECVITDLQMPGMTGIDLHRHLIDAGHAIPTILLTAYVDDRSRKFDERVICYLRKPVDETRLLQCLRAALRSGGPPEENS